MSLRSPTARLFVAVDPSANVARELSSWARQATRDMPGSARSSRSAIRVLDPTLLHVTLCFLGERPVGELDLLVEQLATCKGSPGKLSVGAPLWLPPRQPRALAVELHEDRQRLAQLQALVVASLEEVSGWQPIGHVHKPRGEHGARQRFRPHITVARMRYREVPLERTLLPTPALSFVPAELVLYRSWLAPEGASYEAVAAHPFNLD